MKKTSIAETVLGDLTHYFLFVCIDIILETLTSALRITVSGIFLKLKLHRLSSVFGQDTQHQCLSDRVNCLLVLKSPWLNA